MAHVNNVRAAVWMARENLNASNAAAPRGARVQIVYRLNCIAFNPQSELRRREMAQDVERISLAEKFGVIIHYVELRQKALPPTD
jgi:hypothetical protein